MPTRVHDDHRAAWLDARHGCRGEPTEYVLPNSGGIRIAAVLERIVDDKESDAVTGERSSDACSEKAATVGRSPLVQSLRIISEGDASTRRIVTRLSALAPCDVGRIA